MKMLAVTPLFVVAGVFFAQPSLAAASRPAPLSVQDVMNAARVGEEVGFMSNRAPVIDAQGRIVPGQTSVVPLNSGQGLQDSMRLFQSVTGVDGVENLHGTGQSGQTGATARMTGSADFNCAFERGARKSIAGVLVRLDACELAAGSQRVTTVSLGVCEAALDGAQCAPADFVSRGNIPANTYADFERSRIGIGCSDTRSVCRITVSSTYSISTSGATLKTQGEQKAAELEGKTLADDFAAGYRSTERGKDYEKATADLAWLDRCVDDNEALSSEGKARSCDGKQTVQVSPRADCRESSVCARTVTHLVETTKSCVRTFSPTTWYCSKEAETLECRVTVTVATGEESSSCTQDQTAGGELVATVDDSCIETGASGECVKKQARKLYVFPERVRSVGECHASPLPLAGPYSPGVCPPALRQEDLDIQCAGDGWFGRTLAGSECVDGNGLPLTFRQKSGCGACIKYDVGQTCYGQQPNSTASTCGSGEEYAGCELVESVPESVEGGLVLSQRDVYRCRRSESQCVEWRQSADCQGNEMAHGTDRGPDSSYSDTGSLTQALAQAGVLSAIQQSVNDEGDVPVVRVFSGKDRRCQQPVGLSSYTSNDCCRIDLERTGGSRPRHQCSEADVELAAARRSRFTVYIGDYCSAKSGLTRKCKTRTQTYCAFSGLLPRIVQEQGREQLKQLAESSADAQLQKATMRFRFYADTETGRWGAPVTVNGITVVPWQQSKSCAAATTGSPGFQGSEECGNLTLWVAVCERPGGCGRGSGADLDLPVVPQVGSQYWLVAEVNPLRNATTVISRYAVMKGACATDTGECVYEVSAWPAGVGGKALVSRTLSFPIWQADGGQAGQVAILGDYMLRGLSWAGAVASQPPPTMRLRFSENGGATWVDFFAPSVLDVEAALQHTEVRISGGCNAAANLCEYRLVAPVTVTMKPWGDAKAPDCSGFTLGQLSMLDFSKMDLREWLQSVSARLANGNVSDGALHQAQSHLERLRNGGGGMRPPAQQRTAVVSPAQGFGPFVATVSVSGFYPYARGNPDEDKDPVYRVEIDWGDCSGVTVAEPVGAGGGGFQARHTYKAPNQVDCGAREATIEHAIKVKIYAQSGVYTERLVVRNVWRDF